MEGDESEVPAEGRSARWPLVALMVLVAVPVLVAGVRVSWSGWTPTLDDGFLVTRAFDVFSTRFPLIGQYSMAGEAGGVPAHSLGPVPYWTMAVPVRLLPIGLVPLWMAVLNAGCLASIVGLARRRAGLGFAAATAVVVLLVERALGPVVFAAVWNPWTGLAPLALLAFVAWSVADGDRWLLPVAAVLASASMQAHLTYLVPGLALASVALLGPVVGWMVARRSAGRDGSAEAGSGRGTLGLPARWRGPALAAVAVGLLCWAPPLVQQLTHDPGNLELVAEAGRSGRPTAGGAAAEAAVARVLGVPPTFARPTVGTIESVREGLRSGPSRGVATGVVVLLGLVAAGAWAWRVGDRTVATGVLTAGAFVAAMIAVAAIMPAERVLTIAYSFRWFALAGSFAWLVVGLAASRVVRGRGAAGIRPGVAVLRVPPAWATSAMVAAVALASILPLAAPGRWESWSYRPADRLGDALVAGTEPGGRYLLANNGPFVVSFMPALGWRLRQSGRNPVLVGRAAGAFGDDYAVTGQRCDGVVVLVAGDGAAPAAGRLLATVEVTDPPAGVPDRATLYLTPDPSPAGSC